MRSLCILVLALVLGGCLGPVRTDPDSPAENAATIQQVVRQYLEAIYTGRARDAWNLHSAGTNQGESFDEFSQAVNVAATSAAATRIERVGQPTITAERATVEVVQRLGERTSTHAFTLVREGDGWRIHNPRQPGGRRSL